MLRPMTEMKLYDIRVTVERIEGRSVCGLQVGDYFEVTESSRVRIPEDGTTACMRCSPCCRSSRRSSAACRRRTGSNRIRWSAVRSRGAGGDADRTDRRARANDGGADLREVGLGLQSDKRPDGYSALAQRAEAGGFDVISVFHDLLFQPAIFPLLVIAGATERVRLGPAALNPSTLHPVELAGQAAALDLASGGRAYLGLVTGSWLDRLGLDGRAPVARMREAVEIVRRLFDGDRSGFAGSHFSLAPGVGFEYVPSGSGYR